MKLFKSIFVLAFIITLSCFASDAFAGSKGGHGHKGNSSDHYNKDADKAGYLVGISSHDRNVIRQYLSSNYRSHCPPGLAKKNNGCLPPGQAKKYRIGGVLPGGYSSVSGDLLGLLGPVPRGYQYVQVDKDVLLISEASKKVIDAVTLLSAVNN